ncbi:MAG: TonB-dependent receptor [Aliidiomarina sp.]|uniref:TonB-dependent receptor n=1 Tax=Aliidiomarina sp. TaxID=1872439 RepID=UPI0025B84877|nr:TonB-dependent receptor [Aliidiomarina sp.]MCH8500785.1 TonB-dependent receptor [Aliidiomarina sp.]
MVQRNQWVVSGVALAVAAVLAVSVQAQEAEVERTVSAAADEVERIQVRAAGLRRDVVDMAGPVSVLSGDELVQRAEASIGETLKFEPGVHGNYFGPIASSPVIRGLDGARVQVVHNGMGTGDVSREGPDHAITADAITAQQIEVLRGPATLLYGSGAIGGVINVVDNRIPRSAVTWPETVVQGRFNTAASERSLSFAHDSGSENIAFHADGFYRNGNDYRVPTYTSDDGFSSRRLDNSWSEHQVLNLGTSYVADWGFIGLSYGAIRSEYGLPEGPDDPAEADDGELIKLNQQRFALAAEYQPQHANWDVLTADVAFTDYDHAEYDDGEPETEFTSKAWEVRLSGTYVLPQGWRGIVGYHGAFRDYEAVGEEAFTPSTDTDSQALFWLQERAFGRLTAEFGARVERLTQKAPEVRDSAGVQAIRDSFDLFSWSVGAVYRWREGHQLTSAFSRAERALAANELYANGIHVGTRSYEIGTAYRVNGDEILEDSSLSKVERANNLDVGMRGDIASVSYQVNLFYNEIDNFAYLRNLGYEIEGLTAYQYTQQKARLHGAEASLTWRFLPNQQVTVMGDVVRARLVEGVAGNSNLPRIPPHRFGAEYRYTANQWVATAGVNRYAAQTRAAANESPTSGYTLFDASVNYNFVWNGHDMMWFAKAQNLTNELAFVHSSFIKDDAPLAGRNLSVGLQARF